MEERRTTNTMLIFGFLALLYSTIAYTYATDTLYANQTIRYNKTIVSPQETFELGFFSPNNSKNYYVGIWYKKRAYKTIAWVANRNTPLKHTSGELTLYLQGVLSLTDTPTGNVLWLSANSSRTLVMNPIGQLLDTGNFIIYDGINQENPIWQSFDFPTDTLLPGLKFGRNLVTGVERHLESWKSDKDPASGEFSFEIDTKGYPQVVLMDGTKIKSRGGPWNGRWFTGFPNSERNTILNFTFVLNESEVYFQYSVINTLCHTLKNTTAGFCREARDIPGSSQQSNERPLYASKTYVGKSKWFSNQSLAEAYVNISAEAIIKP